MVSLCILLKASTASKFAPKDEGRIHALVFLIVIFFFSFLNKVLIEIQQLYMYICNMVGQFFWYYSEIVFSC